MGKRTICSNLVIPNWGMTRAENKHLFPGPPVPTPLCSLVPSLLRPSSIQHRQGGCKVCPAPPLFQPLTPPFPQAPLRPSLHPSPHFCAPHPSRSDGAGALHPGWAMPNALLSHRRRKRTARVPPSQFTCPAPPCVPSFRDNAGEAVGPRSPSRPGSRVPPSCNAADTGERENDGAAHKWGARTRGSRTTRQCARGPSREGEMRGTSVWERKGGGGFGEGQRQCQHTPMFAQRSERGQVQPGRGLRGNGRVHTPVPRPRT